MSGEGPAKTVSESSKEYQFTIDSFSEKIREFVEQEIKNAATEDTPDLDQREIYKMLGQTGRALLAKENTIIRPLSSIADNTKIIETIDWLHDRAGIDSGEMEFALARLIRVNLYSQDELSQIINSAHSLSFINGILAAGVGPIIFGRKTNEEIVEMCTNLIKKFTRLPENGNEEQNQAAYRMTSAHQGYQIWNGAKEYIKLGDDLNETLEEGANLADEFVWEKILEERQDELKVLPDEKRFEIIKKIVESIRSKRGLSPIEVDLDPFFTGAKPAENLTRFGFGMQLASRIGNILLPS